MVALRLVADGLFQPRALRPHPYRRSLLALRGRGVACGVLHLLHHAIVGDEVMTDASATHPAPHRHRVSFIALMFGMIAAPIFWLGQLMLGYGVSAVVCYGSDHPTTIAS